MSSCSKGSRGLSVLPRVSRIFTTSAISPSLWLRQRPNRYAFRAGRNLPDKEFRYLRTVIVTAAVYRGLDLLLRKKFLTTPRDLPAPGRRQTLYVVLRLQQSPVFLINSRLDLFTETELSSGSKFHHQIRHPFSRSYGAILPSSLTIVLSIALVCSTHPPVSVCGTGTSVLPRGFSWKYGLTHFTQLLRRPPQPQLSAHLTTLKPTRFHGDVQNPAKLPFSVTPSVITYFRWCRNVYLLCIDYAFRPRLSSRLTLGGLALPRKPWIYGGGVFHTSLVTHASILTSSQSTMGYPTASTQIESSPTTN